MKKEYIYMISVPSAALVLSAVIALPILAVSGTLTLIHAVTSIAFFFYILLMAGATIFAHKMFTGKLHDVIFTFGVALLVSFFLATVVFSLIVNRADFANYDWLGAFERMMNWDWKFYVIQAGIFVVFGAIYFGFFDRDMWKFLRYNGIRGKGKLKQTEANLENSRWMEDDEKKKIFKPYKYSQLATVKKDGVPVMAKLTKNEKDMDVLFNSPCHSIIIGSTGSGKTTTFVNPMIQLLAASGAGSSMIMTDPKGELFSLHSGFLKERGYDVKVIDLRDTYSSYRWNPLDSIWDHYQEYANAQHNVFQHTEKYVKDKFPAAGGQEEALESASKWFVFDGKAYADMKALKTAIKVYKKRTYDEVYEDLNDLVSALVPVENEKDPMWEKGARAITLATLLAMLEDSEDPRIGLKKEKFNFFNLAKILQNSNKDYYELRRYFAGRNPLSKALSLSKQVCDAAESTRASYMSIVYEKLTMFNDSGICALTSASDFIPENLADRPTALFLKIPDEKDTRYNLAAIFMLSIYKALIKIASSYEDLSLPRNVYYILDEFANMPKIDKFDKMITVGRSRKIWFNMIIQSYAQLNNVYGDKVADIVKGNCGIKMFIGSNDMGTCKEYSELCGNITVATNSTSGSVNKTSDVNMTTQLQVRPLIYPSELQRLNHPGDIGHSIVVTFGNYPLMTYFSPSFKVSFYKFGKMDTSELSDRLFDEKEAFYDIRKRNDLAEQDAKERAEKKAAQAAQAEEKADTTGSDVTEGSDTTSGGMDASEHTETSKEAQEEEYAEYVEETKANEETAAEAQKESAEADEKTAQDIMRMWNQYKESHPDAKIEDLFGTSIEPKGGKL
ncbi:MAG: type IV secretory system conjugative DNA transfer family protein [Clostridia bacterium]|nr:type IV secretory system conjugative DNA transfer family protein [Clostridia bacterium]